MQQFERMDESQVKHWQVIYPSYINKRISVREGRRVKKDIAVPNPTIVEIAQACKFLELKCCIEPHKGYPKDVLKRGRVRVLFKDNDGSMQHDTLLTKSALLLKICELIPKMKTRDENPDGYNSEDEEIKEVLAAEPTAQQTKADKKAEKKAEKKKNKKNKKGKW